ncbi:MAG TPA: bifunctional phosphopantothenoylcysteine decarboxylase/phosphopantothenate--cysteine ligase CoaBC [Thermoanaerobaculia bacterium]|nr:bifunctional phosphopantothenoylcysteine decarboxylase/phosphopantothenate--cysteine ligase CoaBC [Thermoanaerobaculia bacterium]
MSRRLLLGVSGGIAAVKAPDLVRRLRERDLEVRCALTRAAEAFVTPLALEVLSGHPVYGEAYLSPGRDGVEQHVEAARWAELLLVAPATAHALARLAHGLADDFLTTAALAFRGPLVVAPAMHPRMWEHPATRRNCETLAGRGVRFLGPEVGPLASGEEGVGRMSEPQVLADAVAGMLAAGPLSGARVLVTAGPTWEPVDPVRVLANRSSGKMGFALAAEAAARGAAVTLVAGPVALPTPWGVERVDVETAREMRDAALGAAPDADLVLMTAAVADFRPRDPASRKLKRQEGVPRLELEATPDILADLVAAAPGAVVVGFAAETDDLRATARAKLERKGVDFLVANDVSRRDVGFGSDFNEVVVFRRQGEPVALPRAAKRQLAGPLLDLFAAALVPR